MEAKEPIRVKHFCNIGDLVASLCAVKQYYVNYGSKIIYCQQTGVPAQYYPGAVHPVMNQEGINVCMNDRIWEMAKPLLLAQEYIHDVELYTGQKVKLDLDIIRGDEKFVNLPNGSIQAWLMYAYPDLAADISIPWVTIPEECPPHILEQVKGKVLLNFTERYRNHKIDYFFLQKYQNHLLFSGTTREHQLFCETWKINVPLLEAADFLEVAHAIKHSRFLLCNQSSAWNISTAMGTPRILETCRFAPNCMPNYGPHNYGFFYQVGLEYYFDKLYH